MGAIFAQDRWEIADAVTATVGGRFSYIGFLDDANHFDPSVSLEIKRDDAHDPHRGSVAAARWRRAATC